MKTLCHLKRKPTHPGAVLRQDVLPALHISEAELARRLRVSRPRVNQILRERKAVNADMAVRLAILTKTTPESWLRMQEALDLWELQRDPKRYRHIEAIAA